MLEIDFERRLSGENLAFYQNIEYLKELTAHARALLSRSNAVYKDMIEIHEFKDRLTAIEEDEVLETFELRHGECSICGLEHGAQGFCIIDLIMKEEAMMDKKRHSKKASFPKIIFKDEEEAPQDISSTQYVQYDGKSQKWEGLLHQKMRADELYNEYNRICRFYGFQSGQKFLYARSLARRSADVEISLTDKKILHGVKDFKLPSDTGFIKSDCVPLKKDSSSPFHQRSNELNKKLASVMDITPPRNISGWGNRTVWKDRIKTQKNVKFTTGKRIDDRKISFSGYRTSSLKSSSFLQCKCNMPDCYCAIKLGQPCSPPSEKCTLYSDQQNNYLDKIRERLNRKHHATAQFSADTAVTYEKESDLMLKAVREINLNDLKSRMASAVGMNTDETFDKRVMKIADLTYPFKSVESGAWNEWSECYKRQQEVEDDYISGDSTISTGDECSSGSTTEEEFPEFKLSKSGIPFAEETYQLAENLFCKINAKFMKSVVKSSLSSKLLPHRPVFDSSLNKVLLWMCGKSKSVGDFGKLSSTYWNALKPAKVRQYRKMKRLEATNKRLSKMQKRRRWIEGIQLGRRFKPAKKSINFTKAGQYKGFNAVERELLRNPVTKRFPACPIIVNQEERNVFSKANIHHHYRLLRNLFDNPSQSEECLMDQGMKERLLKFRERLGHSFQSHREDVSCEDVRSARSISRLIKTEESRLTTAAPDVGGFKPKEYLYRSVRKHYDTCRNSSVESQKGFASNGKSSRRNFGGSNSSGPMLSYRMTDQSPSMMNTVISSRERSRESTTNRLPTPPLSESDCEKSDVETVYHRVPRKDEARMQRSARSDFQERGTERVACVSITKGRSYFPYDRYPQDSLTDGSSSSYVPALLQLPSRSGHQITNRAQGRAQRTLKKKDIRWKQSSDSSSSDEPTKEGNISKERPAWNRRRRRNKPQNDPKQSDEGCRTDFFQRGRMSIQEKHFSGNQAVSEIPRSLQDRSHSKNEQKNSQIKKNQKRHVSENSLPKPPWVTQKHCSSTSQFRSESSYPTFPGECDSFYRPSQVITERLLKGGMPPDESPKKQSTLSRITPELTRPILSSSLRNSAPGSKVVSVNPAVDVSVIEPIQSEEPQKCEEGKVETSKRASGFSISKGCESVALSPTSMRILAETTESKSNFAKFRQRSRQFSDAFRKRSIVDGTKEQSSNKIVTKNVSQKPRLDDVKSQQDPDPSVSSLARKLQKMQMLGPTRRKCFDLDIGQGINCVRYLKENSPGADEMKKRELVDLLTSPIEEKKSSKVEKDLSMSSSVIGRKTPASQGSRSISTSHIESNRRIKPQDLTISDGTPLKNMQFKTLDEIFKEVHGINKRNTPERYVENEYEFESHKKQQLKRHKI